MPQKPNNHESKPPVQFDTGVHLLDGSIDEIASDPKKSEHYYEERVGWVEQHVPHFTVDLTSVSESGFSATYFDGDRVTTAINHSTSEGTSVRVGSLQLDAVTLDHAVTMTKVLNHHLTPEGRNKLFSE